MQSYTEYNEQSFHDLEPAQNKSILGGQSKSLLMPSIDLVSEGMSEIDDIHKLEQVFRKLVNNGKLSKKQIVSKLIEVCGVSESKQDTSILSRSVNNAVDEEFENMPEDTSRDSSSRIALEEQRHRHKISNTNSNFYKFRSQQDQLQNLPQERPKSSKGGVRSSAANPAQTLAHHQSTSQIEMGKQ